MTTYELLVQLESSLDNAGPTKRSWEIIDELKERARGEHERMYARARPIGIGDMAGDLDIDTTPHLNG